MSKTDHTGILSSDRLRTAKRLCVRRQTTYLLSHLIPVNIEMARHLRMTKQLRIFPYRIPAYHCPLLQTETHLNKKPFYSKQKNDTEYRSNCTMDNRYHTDAF